MTVKLTIIKLQCQTFWMSRKGKDVIQIGSIGVLLGKQSEVLVTKKIKQFQGGTYFKLC